MIFSIQLLLGLEVRGIWCHGIARLIGSRLTRDLVLWEELGKAGEGDWRGGVQLTLGMGYEMTLWQIRGLLQIAQRGTRDLGISKVRGCEDEARLPSLNTRVTTRRDSRFQIFPTICNCNNFKLFANPKNSVNAIFDSNGK